MTKNKEKMVLEHDISIFADIPSQTSPSDRLSLLAMQNSARSTCGDYVYLEIGSHIGGTIQPYLHDSKCRHIYSIDKRPMIQPDERGLMFEYENNSTSDMLARLEKIAPDKTKKIICIESDARNVDHAAIKYKPNICFIDGEHTTETALSDFEFCKSVCDESAIICFHDSHITYKALIKIIRKERKLNPKTSFKMLGGSIMALGLNDTAIMKDSHIVNVSRNMTVFFIISRLFMLTNNILKTICGESILRAFYTRRSSSKK